MTDTMRHARRENGPLRPMLHPGRSAITGAIGIVVVIVFGLLVAHNTAWNTAELHVLQWFSDQHQPWLDAIALGINTLFSPPFAIVISLVCAVLVFVRTASLVRAGVFLLVVAASWGGSEVVKYIVHRPRPDSGALSHMLIIETSYSYPSGHTCFAAALVLAFVFTLRSNRWRTTAIVVGAVVVVVTALSRVYLGVHNPTDVTASIVYSLSAAAVLAPLIFNVAVPWLRNRMPAAGDRSVWWGRPQ